MCPNSIIDWGTSKNTNHHPLTLSLTPLTPSLTALTPRYRHLRVVRREIWKDDWKWEPIADELIASGSQSAQSNSKCFHFLLFYSLSVGIDSQESPGDPKKNPSITPPSPPPPPTPRKSFKILKNPWNGIRGFSPHHNQRLHREECWKIL